MTHLEFSRVAPMVSVQDRGRFGALEFGVTASGPMDRSAFFFAAKLLAEAGACVGAAAIECAGGELEFVVRGGVVRIAFCGGQFNLALNSKSAEWNRVYSLADGDVVKISPGNAGNYAIMRFDHEFDVAQVVGSQSTNMVAKLGGIGGRLIEVGDILGLHPANKETCMQGPIFEVSKGPVRVIWGLHGDLFSKYVREQFLACEFVVSASMDRMGVRLLDKQGVFSTAPKLSLVSDTIVPGDIQILGDGTPVVLMRDHQPTGGYPRIATIISADIDRFAQYRAGTKVRFVSVSVAHAHELYRAGADHEKH